ncbi:hypothetical protein AGDE_12696 [Angomonas deanei]|nr:hypothetical protein AGDE_12696 [Angomonas deanei]|eukprot:EPY23985.1 hypothetical protein AGDE_12696 [Angomonas deanei]
MQPGDVVYGRLEVDVAASLTLSNIRVDVNGNERITVDKSSHTYTETVRLLRHRIICFGFDGNKERVELAQGSYSYPFTFQIPVTAPPSVSPLYGWCRLSVSYTMEVIVDIPDVSDTSAKIPITVHSIVGAQQMIDSEAAVEYETALVAPCSCCEKEDKSVDVSVRIVPSMSLLTSDTMYYSSVMGHLADAIGGNLIPADVQHLFPDGLAPFTLGIIVTVRNHTTDTEIDDFEATLCQQVEGRIDVEGTDMSVICSAKSKGHYVGPGEEGQFVIRMDLRKAYEKGKLRPAIETEFATLKQYISVQSVNVPMVLRRTYPFMWAARVDETNCCPMLPATYGNEIVVSTNNYLASGAGAAVAPTGGYAAVPVTESGREEVWEDKRKDV